MTKIYLASSWRNIYQPSVLKSLREAGHEVYDFKNPKPGDNGFGWKSIDPNWQQWSVEQHMKALETPIALASFANDFAAMEWADTGVLLLPCGRSAHIEAGYFVGAKKPLYILLAEGEPELMYLMATELCVSVGEVIKALARS